MASLLVRNVDEALVRKLKRRAAANGVSAQEEHRRILEETLSTRGARRPSLMEFLTSAEAIAAPEVELELARDRSMGKRDIGL